MAHAPTMCLQVKDGECSSCANNFLQFRSPTIVLMADLITPSWSPSQVDLRGTPGCPKQLQKMPQTIGYRFNFGVHFVIPAKLRNNFKPWWNPFKISRNAPWYLKNKSPLPNLRNNFKPWWNPFKISKNSHWYLKNKSTLPNLSKTLQNTANLLAKIRNPQPSFYSKNRP